jgi:4-hydroxy-2-oxoglutarate aldolase
MEKKVDLSGIFPPIPTPFYKEEVDYDKLSLNVEKWSKTGLAGFVIFGSNGEYPYLSRQEKLQTVKTVGQTAPKSMTLIAGTGCESTRETLDLTNAGADQGAHAALVVTPHYFGDKMTSAALIKHYTTIADRAAIPVLLYNVPKFTHINLTVEVVAELSRHPNIIGIKDSSGNVAQLGEYLNHVDKNFQVLVGMGSALFGALTLGCSGGVLALANIAPAACVSIFNLVRKGEFTAARDLQLKMIPVNKAVTGTYGIAGLKASMDLLGYYGGDPRPPLLPASEKEKGEIKAILATAGLLYL